MNDQMGPGSLLDTTDSLEAVGVFRGWKNFMFLIVFICLLLVQGGFWLVNAGLVEIDCACCAKAEADPADPDIQDANEAMVAPVDPNKPAEAVLAGLATDDAAVAEAAAVDDAVAEAVLADLAADDDAAPKSALNDVLHKVTFQRLCWGLSIVNAILILSACVYVLTILFSLKVSIVGKLGGVSHISRAFFLALFMFVLLLPWQRIFGGMVVGAIYTPCELVKAYSAERTDLLANILYYLRFSGYWFLMFLLLIITQMRTCRWTRAILHRLEVV